MSPTAARRTGPRTGCCTTVRVERETLTTRAEEDYSAMVRFADMVPPQEHLSDEAETRTIWALTYMCGPLSVLRVVGVSPGELRNATTTG